MILHLLLAALMQEGPSDPAAEAARRAAEDAARAAATTPAADREPACRRDGNTPEINACFAEDLRREEARMEIYLRRAEERAREADELTRAYGGPSAQRGYLASSQAVWRAYAEIVCDGVHDAWKDGTIRTVMHLDCMTEMTRERTHVIWRHHLTHADGSLPVLPEPVETVADELRREPPPPARPSTRGS
ncbi:MAG: DUF1311 domain-containing protein [Brevundimonas sp.]|uniref:lysozyme inhibitor LprI family protein n=1 Tax=Brevundimonas sp. TaxID=1871086 RepID=UPI0017C610E9|nr:lysozyme inhibitor LprI family protein [Brevundimonas sp.]MBA4803090.1 DUF1311 domain-containing protein [Brevundimonas sp.]